MEELLGMMPVIFHGRGTHDGSEVWRSAGITEEGFSVGGTDGHERGLVHQKSICAL
jgi:hypothetical protein